MKCTKSKYNGILFVLKITLSIKDRTNETRSSVKHKLKSKKAPILQRQGSKDSLSGQSNQPAYVEQLLKLREKKR